MIFSVELLLVLIVSATIVPKSVASSETRIYIDPSERYKRELMQQVQWTR